MNKDGFCQHGRPLSICAVCAPLAEKNHLTRQAHEEMMAALKKYGLEDKAKKRWN